MGFNPAAILYDSAGNAIVSAIALPSPTDRGLVVRNIPLTTVHDMNNSSTTPLGSNGVFTGTSTDTTGYASISFSASSDVISAVNGIEIQWSNDNTNWSTRGTSQLPATRLGQNNATDLNVRVHDKYFRIKYTNGAVAQSFFRLYTCLHTYPVTGDGKGVDQTPASGDDAILTKAVLTGKRPTSEGSGYTDVLVDATGSLMITETNTHAAFGALLTANENVRVNMSFPYGINTRLTNVTTANSATVTGDTGRAKLSTGTNSAGSAGISSRDAIKYTPGQGVVCRFTAVFTTGVANSRQEIGVGDDNDGFFFGYNGTSFGVCRRVGGTDNWVAQSSWNGDDKLDGTGPSGHTLDPTKGYPYQIQYQWLGFGAIRYFVENPFTGDFVLVHTIRYAGTATVPSINNPTLPLWAKVVNTGNTSDIVLYTPSMGALVEGLSVNTGSNVNWSFTNVSAAVVTAGTCLFSLQNKATNVLGGTNTNRVSALIEHISLRSGTNDDVWVTLFLNATITTPTWVDVSTNTSVIQTDILGTTTGTGGIPLRSWSLSAKTSMSMDVSLYNLRIRPGQTLSLVAFNEAAGSGTTRGSIGWQEEF